MSNEKMRAEFEAHCARNWIDIGRAADGTYTDASTQRAWEAWQASRLSMQGAVVVPDTHVLVPKEPTPDMDEAGTAALTDAGIDDVYITHEGVPGDAVKCYRAMISCVDMLRESAKQHRLNGDKGHAVVCERIAENAESIAPSSLRTITAEELERYRSALERIAAYPKTPQEELGYVACRNIARAALKEGSEP